MFDYSKLRGRIVEKFGSCEAFAKQLNITNVTVSKKLNNKSGFSLEDIILWTEKLDIHKNEIGVYFFTLKVQAG